MVLNAIVRAAWQLSGYCNPLVAIFCMCLVKDAFLIGGPWVASNTWLQLIEITLAALFTSPIGQLSGDSTPRLECRHGWRYSRFLID